MGKHRLRFFEKSVIRRIFRPIRVEGKGSWRKQDNEEFHNLWSSTNIIFIIKSRRTEPCYFSQSATSYGEDDRVSRIRFPAGAGNFSLHHRVQNGSGAHPASYPMDTGALSLGVKRPGREAYHSPPSSAEVKIACCYTSIPPIRLHGVVFS
jgi:hypothetical protein